MEGQIIKIISNSYIVKQNNKSITCTLRGKFRNEKITPVVGDYCLFDEKEQVINEILPRKNTLIRPPVSNIDNALIVTSLKEPNLDLNLLDKLLVTLNYYKIKPIICITKKDLLKGKEKSLLKIISYYKKIGYQVVYNTNIYKIKKILKHKTTVLIGQTGAGKTTLLNKLDKKTNRKTGEISKKLGRGKHTTRCVELIEVSKGKLLDTPGFSMIDLKDLSNEEIKSSFIEFNKYKCPYKDCNHLNEKECSIKKEVSKGKILSTRYENYTKFILKK